MKERPIIFNSEMVKAILEGRKSQTRRLLKLQAVSGVRKSPFVKSGLEDGHGNEIKLSYGQIGDRLWVRHSFYEAYKESYNYQIWDEFNRCIRWANRETKDVSNVGIWEEHGLKEFDSKLWHKKPSIHFPRWASRITLEITDVRVEKIQNISYKDSELEGFTHREHFIRYWESIYGKDSWELNPLVRAISFKRI